MTKKTINGMDREQAFKAWIEALCGSKYEQGEGALCSRGKYCCLGVLCEVLDVEKFGRNIKTYHYGDDADRGFLPEPVRVFMGIPGDFQDKLVKLNDQLVPFPEIASEIEEWIESEK